MPFFRRPPQPAGKTKSSRTGDGPDPRNDTDTYCRGDAVSFPVGGDETLVYAKASRTALVLTNLEAQLMRHCQTFKSLRDHAVDFCRRHRLSDGDVGAIETHLAQLAEDDVLLSNTHIHERCRAFTAVDDHATRISSVAVITRNRSAAALRCLGDLLGEPSLRGRDVACVVIDDSPDATVRQRYRDGLRSMSKRERVVISYAGSEEKEQFISALLDEAGRGNLPPRAVDFALFGTEELTYRSGANRNASLLHATAEAFLSLDDDVRGRAGRAHATRGGLTISSVDDPTELWFFASHADALASAAFEGDSLFDAHEQMLGRTASTCVAKLSPSGQLDLRSANAPLLTNLVSGLGRVRATMTGIVGDCAMRSNMLYLTLEGEAHRRLVGSGAEYQALRSTREILRVAPTWTINEGGLFMTTAAALDNTTMLPPFFPVQRNSDVIFSNMLRLCSSEWLVGHLPWVIEHDPAEHRAFPDHPATRVTQTLTPEVVLYCMESVGRNLASPHPAERLQTIGRRLQGVGRMAHKEFEDFLRLGRWQRITQQITRLEGVLESYHGAPESWRADVERCIDAARGSLMQGDISPADLATACEPTDALALVQRLLYQFGELLEHWPNICRAARSLRENGRRLAVPVR